MQYPPKYMHASLRHGTLSLPPQMFPTFVPFIFFLISGFFFRLANAQLVNGQFFTRGLAISNAPAPNRKVSITYPTLKQVLNAITDLSCSEFTVGGTISVSVDVSGDGRLPQGSWGPDSTLPSGFISLSIFLVSGSQNVTIVNGTTGDFLRGEPGSTVKHLNYVIPSCLSEGDYNVSHHTPHYQLWTGT
jgi:hypothetical protein